jgi:hypothetical protein
MKTERINIAIEKLKDGHSFTLDDLRLEIQANSIIVIGWSKYSNLENLTKHHALKELREIKKSYTRLLEVSSELRNFLVDKIPEYNLYFDDYGKASIIICSMKNEIVKWEMELQ